MNVSEYLLVQTVYDDEALLRQAIATVCKEYVIRPELFQVGEEQSLHGYLGEKRPESAQFIIPKRYLSWLSNDIGWQRLPNGTYRLIISEYDQNHVERARRITEDVDVEYQRLLVERQVQKSIRLRGRRVIAQRDAKTGVVQLRIQNVRV